MENRKNVPAKKERKRIVNPKLDNANITFTSNKLEEANKVVTNLVLPKN